MKAKAPKPFHVVRRAHNDVTVTYCIYENNEPYLVPPRGKKLRKREAYWIASLLNGDGGR